MFWVVRIGAVCLLSVLISGVAAAGNLQTDLLGSPRVFAAGMAFDVRVVNERGVVVDGLGFQVRDNSLGSDGTPTGWNFRLFYRSGRFDELVGGLPAHRVASAWTEVGGSAGTVSSPARDDFFFTPLSLTDSLLLAEGIHSFYIHGDNAGIGSTTGSAVVTRAAESHGVLASNSDLQIWTGTSKGGLFDASSTIRRGAISLTYTAVPEPSSCLLGLAAAGLLNLCHFKVRSGRRA